MSTKKRLDNLEQQAEDRLYRHWKYASRGRSVDEMQFLAVHGYSPECLGKDLPSPHEFTVKGIRTVVTVERVKESSER